MINNNAELLAQATQLANLWNLIVEVPSRRQLLLWLTRYSPEVMKEAVNALGTRLERIEHIPSSCPPTTTLDKLKYVCSRARNIAAAQAVR